MHGTVAETSYKGNTPGSYTKRQEELSLQFTCYAWGFLDGVNAMCISGLPAPNAGENSANYKKRVGRDTIKLAYPPQSWFNVANIAPLLYSFIQQYKPQMGPDTSARQVMQAWYVMSHPDANQKEKTLGLVILTGIKAANN